MRTMMTYTEIRKLAVQLPLVDRAHLLEELAATLPEAISQVWDERIAADIQAGKLDALADGVLADFAAGRCAAL